MEMAAGAGTGTAAGTRAWLTVLTTTDDPEKAQALARGAVEARAAACAQIAGPVTSVYRWKERWRPRASGRCCSRRRVRGTTRWRRISSRRTTTTPRDHRDARRPGSADYLRWVEEETVEETAE